MANADPVQFKQPTPLAIDERLRERVADAVVTQGGFRHDRLNAFLRTHLSGSDIGRGALFSEPVVEGAAAYRSSGKRPADLAGTLLHPDLVHALTDPGAGADYLFDHAAYAHQLKCWELLSAPERNSVLVSSGTGSGKTECFLVPLLSDLAAEAADSGRLTGVRALMLYPLNALIASQQERLTRWTAPFGGRIRFALYNGQMQDKRKNDRDRAEQDVPEQVLYRTTLRADPPPILVTNNTMLEYMTIRREDYPIVEKSRGMLRWIVIDEAHSYIGSAAAEVSLLLRRVLETFEVAARDVRFVATSATIGGTGEAARVELQRYLADLAGVPIAHVHVVTGHRQPVTLPSASSEAKLRPADLDSGLALAANSNVQAFVREAEASPVAMRRVAALAADTGVAAPRLLEAIAEKRCWNGSAGGEAPLLPLRVHKFVRAVPGLWSCLNPRCDGDRPVDWPFGALLFERAEKCLHCDAPAFELLACRECGEPWLNAYQHGDRLTPAAMPADDDEFAAASAREDDGQSGADDSEEDEGASAAHDPGLRRLIATRSLEGLRQIAVDFVTGALPERRGEEFVWISGDASDEACARCHAGPTALSASPLWPFRFGAPFLIQNATPTMLEGVAPSARSGVELPAEGRQLLSFTDSRQGTARFAANIETMSERGYVRAFVYHMVQKAPAGGSSQDRAELEQLVAALREQAANLPILEKMLTQKEAELAGYGQAEPVPWVKAVKALSDDPMVDQWIRSVWDRDQRFRSDPQAFARFLLLRELARRPRRANAIETLGLAKLVFHDIEAIPEARLPELFKRKGRTLEEWKSFLYFIIDTSVRAKFGLNISRDDARWLLPRRAFLRHVVGPGNQKRIPSDLVWPQARGAGTKPLAVSLLEQALALDSGSGSDRAEINEVLATAWAHVRPILEGTGSTYALDFDKAAIAAVSEAWLCPVTHRVLPRLAFGRTPHGVRGHPPGATDMPLPLLFPALPGTFPTSAKARAELSAFVASYPAVETLRRHGVWRDLHDRAATFAPYIRAEEHSAQQPPWRLRGFEAEFKQGEINILACSTTMEMGVDIGSVEAVLNTNVPPSIANYRQRIGRAGRRNQGFASSLTLARDTPLDREAFRDPVCYLAREVRAPRVKLDSARIVQRHVNALLLARWFREASGELIRVKAGDFFGYPQGLGLEPDQDPPADRFVRWLREPSTHVSTALAIANLTYGTALAGASDLAECCAVMFETARQSFGRAWQALREQAFAATVDARTAVEIMARRMCREPLLSELAQRSVLPGSGFPTAIIPFINDCRETRNRPRGADMESAEATRNRRYDYPSRNADIAIREYAPGAEVVIDGLVWTSSGVTLNWQRPAHDEQAREIQSLRTFWSCVDCSACDCAATMVAECPACGSTAIEQSRFLAPAGFRVDWNQRPHADTDRVEFIAPETARVSARGARWEPLLDPGLGRARSTAEGLVFHASRGAAKAGYRVCLDCGRAEEDGSSSLAGHEALVPQKGGGERCTGNDKPFTITEPLALGHEVLTDVLELQPRGLDDAGAAWALASALREALARRLGIEPRELGLGVDLRQGELGERAFSLFLYDQSAGGAGYAPQLLDDPAAIIDEVRTILACPVECERACSACVLAPDLYAQQEIIDRRGALAAAERLWQGTRVPGDEDAAADGATLTPPVADALSRQMVAGERISLFAPDGFDLATLAAPPFSLLFGQAARRAVEVRLVLPEALFDQLDEAARRGLRNASHRHQIVIATGAMPTGHNGIPMVAARETDEGSVGFFSRDPSGRAFGPDWGIGAEHPVVAAALRSAPQSRRVPEDAMERSARPEARVRIIHSESARPIRQFGQGLVERLLKPELEAVGAWKPGRLASLAYSDRYLKSPLTVLLMTRTLAALRETLSAQGASVEVTIAAEPLRRNSYGGPPRRVGNDWSDEDDRRRVIEALASQSGFALCRYAGTGASHGRKLTIGYDDGTEAVVLLDQGFGYWRTSGPDGHDFTAPPGRQVQDLLACSALVGGHGESYIALLLK